MAKRDAAVVRVVAESYWSEEAARVVVEAWRRSGQTLVAFARSYGVKPKRLARWARRLGSTEPEAISFYPVRVVERERERARRDERIELVLGAGWCVRVPQGFAAEDLRQVLDVLEARR